MDSQMYHPTAAHLHLLRKTRTTESNTFCDLCNTKLDAFVDVYRCTWKHAGCDYDECASCFVRGSSRDVDDEIRSLHPHPIERQCLAAEFRCDICGIPGQNYRYRCEPCDYDECYSCFAWTRAQLIPIFKACEEGNIDEVARFLENAGDAIINARNDRGWTLLHISAYFGHLEITKMLIKAKVNINARSFKGDFRKPSGWCGTENRGGGLTALQYAVEGSNKNEDMIIELLKNGADVHNRDDDGRNAAHSLLTTPSDSNIPILRLLVKGGLDLNVLDRFKMSPLSYALWLRDSQLVSALIDEGAFPDEGVIRYASEHQAKDIEALLRSRLAKHRHLHRLLEMTATKAIICDICQKHLPTQTVVHSCRQCNYDECPNCFARGSSDIDETL